MPTINRHHEKRIFSQNSFFASFDKDFNIEWCDNFELFHRIELAHIRIKRKFKLSKKNTVTHIFLYKGVYHRAIITKTINGNFACRIAKEIVEEYLEIDELFEYLDEISHNCLNVLSLTDMLDEYISNTGYSNDFFHEHFKEQRRETTEIYNYCNNVLTAFKNKANEEFIPLQKYIMRTFDVVRRITRKLPININVFTNILHTTVKIDYSKLELAFFNLVKFILIHSTTDKNIFITVNQISDDEIAVETKFRIDPEFNFSDSNFELHIIKYLFRQLNGHFEFYEENNVMYANGTFSTVGSENKNDIVKKRNLKLVNYNELKKGIANNTSPNRYVDIYGDANKSYKTFYSKVTNFSDVESKSIRFAEMFFEDVLLKL